MITPVILCGGNGTRLWPLSRDLYPKQLLALTGDKTLIKEVKMRVHSKYYVTLLCLSALLYTLTACTGISEQQLTLDPTYAKTLRIHNSISLKRSEFHQLQNEYVLDLEDAHLERMSQLMKLVREELLLAEYIKQNNKYYREGIAYERWKLAENTLKLGRKTLCEMMLDTGMLQMLYADKEKASTLFNAVVSEFEEEGFPGYVEQAREFLQEIERAGLYASAKKP